MSFLKKMFGNKNKPIKNYAEFWNWFQQNEEQFHKAVKEHSEIEKKFFEKLSPKLNDLREGYYFLTGMMNDTTAELVITADGMVKNIVFVEELVNAAPKIDGWKFTALKPSLNIEDVSIQMADYHFTKENICFYYNEDANYPDEIDVIVVNKDLTEANKDITTNGTFIFLDNLLGELNFATTVDNIKVIGLE